MTSTVLRVDSWKPSEDKYLAKTVLTYVREGKTQLQAFEHCAEKMNRSAAACGFRWNNEVRKKYERKLRGARKEWRQKKKNMAMAIQEQPMEPVEFTEPIMDEPESNLESSQVEWLTTGQMIDGLKVGEIAEGIGEFGNLGKRKVEVINTANDGIRFLHENGEGKAIRISETLLKLKWRILPNFVSFIEAMNALSQGKTVTYHDNHKEGYTFDLKAEWSLEEAAGYTLNDLFKSRWTIE